MTGKQVGFVILAVLMCVICNRPQTLYADPIPPVKCEHTGCWNMQPDTIQENSDWEFSGSGVCYSYNKPHAPYETMSTQSATGGAWTKQTGKLSSYKSKANCTKGCEAAGKVQAAFSGSFESLAIETQYLCQ